MKTRRTYSEDASSISLVDINWEKVWNETAPLDSVEPGYLPRSEIQKRWGVKASAAGARLRGMIAEGTMIAKQFRVTTPAGIKDIMHYRPVPASKVQAQQKGLPS